MSTPQTEEHKTPIPAPAVVLGAAGLIPFLFLSGLWLTGSDVSAVVARQALIAYSIAILSFMGAVHWGLAMTAPLGDQPWRRYFVSVLPALAGTATALISGGMQFVWLAVCFLALLLYDLYAVKRDEAPSWYPRLRWPLTVVVCVCLSAAGLRGS